MPYAFINGSPVKHSLGPSELKEALKAIDTARSTTASHLCALKKAIEIEDGSGQITQTNWLLKSPEALLTSAVAANASLKPHMRKPLEVLFNIAKTLNFGQPLAEAVSVYAEPKSSGGYRAIHNPGIRHRTAQNAIMRVLGAYFVPRSFQFTHSGVHAAMKRVKQAIKGGYFYSARLDIKDFYPSFELEKLVPELPLPIEVVEHAVVGRQMKVVMDQEFTKQGVAYASLPHTHKDLLIQARLGLPQGSSCSPIIGMYVVSRLVWPSMPSVVLINYVDDFLLLAPDPNVLDWAIGELTSAVAHLPGGHFNLVLKAQRQVAKGFEFLGHRLQLVNGTLRTEPTGTNVQSFISQINFYEEKIGNLKFPLSEVDKERALEWAAAQFAIINGWKQAFVECDAARMKEWVDWATGPVFDTAHKCGANIAKVAGKVEPWMGVKLGDYALK